LILIPLPYRYDFSPKLVKIIESEKSFRVFILLTSSLFFKMSLRI